MDILYYVDISKYKVNRKTQSELGRRLLKYVLNKFNIKEYKVVTEEGKKPYLEGVNIHFNIAHSHNIVVLAISDKEVGVDVEVLDYHRDLTKPAKYLFTKEELETYKGLEKNEKTNYFYANWVRKEAYFKEKGIGLTKEFSNISLNYNIVELEDCIYMPYYATMSRDNYEIEEINITELEDITL